MLSFVTDLKTSILKYGNRKKGIIVLEIAMALRLKGIAGSDAIAEMTGRETDEVEGVLQTMVEAGHAQETPRGLRLLPEGKEWVDSLLDEEREGVDQTLMNNIYEAFCLHNDTFKQLVTDWQIKIVDGEQVMNDHEDATYDAAIITRLEELDNAVQPVFTNAAELAPRLGRYVERFADALEKLQSGDGTYLAAPLKDSYHTVWFEMHEELILLSGRNRADEAAAGRGA